MLNERLEMGILGGTLFLFLLVFALALPVAGYKNQKNRQIPHAEDASSIYAPNPDRY